LTTTPVTNIGVAGMKLAGHAHASPAQDAAGVQQLAPQVTAEHATSGGAASLELHAANNNTSAFFTSDLR